MRINDAKKLIIALARRRHNDALRIKRLRRRLNDGPIPTKCFISSISSSKVPEELTGYFVPSKLNAVLKKLKKVLIKNGKSGTGKVAIDTVDKYGHSRDYFYI